MNRKFPSKPALFFICVTLVIMLACNVGVTATPAQLPAETTAAPAGPPPIQHNDIPVNLPETRLNQAGDYDASTTAARHLVNGGDRFTFGQFERPFNANTMDVYFPYLDIQDTRVFQDEAWIYALITLKGGDDSGQLAGNYGMELDTDVNGKGDWLVIASRPAGAEWTTGGVQVYQDADGSVGAATAMYTDKNAAGNGFESLVFDQGHGDDPDLAWARISPDDPNTIQFAVKRSMIGNDDSFLIGMWAGNSSLDPGQFDINDSVTHEQAGEADPGYEVYYPIKAVAELDNSCRMAVGFSPNGREPGLCPSEKPVIVEGPGGCFSDPAAVFTCQQQGPEWSWDYDTCTCNYTGPN